ncbi:MAG: amidohydrolase family protein [Dehalococcoidales bacterium]
MVSEHEAWLGLTLEEPLDPDLPICDPHHHLWDRPDDRYLLEELLRDTGGGHRIVRTVFVECRAGYRKDGPQEMQPVGETEFVAAIAAGNARQPGRMTDVAAGIVGFADLTSGSAVIPVLEAHIAASPDRFRGIRHISAWDASPDIESSRTPPPGLLMESKFREGFACLKKYNLSFDAWLYHPQLMELVDLARAFPDITIILNHIAGPLGTGPYTGKKAEVFHDWQRDIAALAACHNVFVKLGGLGMTRNGFGWHEQASPPNSTELAEAMTPFFGYCIEQFGPDRCMFESNFPVDKVAYSYTVLWNAFKRIAGDCSPPERAALFHDTAVKAYRLQVK